MANFYDNYYRYNPYIPNPSYNKDNINKNSLQSNDIEFHNKKSSKYNSFGPIHFKTPLFTNIEEPIFEIFGIKLYLDDIIILGLLFFLYKENVQDQMLYMVLILLLIS